MYKILVTAVPTELEKLVVEHLEDGWELLGTPYSVAQGNFSNHYQAVTKAGTGATTVTGVTLSAVTLAKLNAALDRLVAALALPSVFNDVTPDFNTAPAPLYGPVQYPHIQADLPTTISEVPPTAVPAVSELPAPPEAPTTDITDTK